MTAETQALVDELATLLRIPSVSADPAHVADVTTAGEWVRDFVRGAGGEAELADWHGQPLAIGELRASSGAADAPTVLCYGHFDVQPPAPLDLWESEPFEPTARDGWLYARGVADDKGQLFMLLKAAEQLAAEGALPVNVRFACDGEEETGGHSIVEFLAEDERGADVAVIFDGGMLAPGKPCFNLATRGLNYFHVTVSTGERDLHSGVYGGAALNGLHALMQTLSGVLPQNGRVPEPLRAGVIPPTEAELASWASLNPGAAELADQGARPRDPLGAEEFYVRTWAEPSVDVHGLKGGEATLQKTVLPVLGEANVSIRLVPGQDPDEIAERFERLLREAAPAGADVEVVRWSSAPAGVVPADSPAVRLGQDAFEAVLGVRPLLVRTGGSLPIVPALADQGIPAIVTGFDLPNGNVHSPNERLLLEYLPLGVATARELFRRFAALG